MVDARVTVGLGIAAAGLILLCVSLPKLDPRPSAQPWRADGLHPLVALAWSNAHCATQISPRSATPGLQADDLLEISARFDETEYRQGHEAACSAAMTLAAAVAETEAPSNNEAVRIRLLAQSR